ncbi:hypothetical protein GUITHDRAFT_101647 [Guillardia theta CCMP2712]|uniref:Uncharacterized protein n=3 Tax=Guillardia theta TaxID=55529 RepID=L1JW92_GUITC|nr:hypothetical protein GUITHDRAFT_101647 [Guillardia theta CCMP2712]EKX52475.1 hypothetical protein GUITHDRAFT_101647 [Guillardia theta CCMP2712]|eukprot:XP_005839455.1 hypothetical protein GUITHDRAFT_101647 [Guillardia theta CCMP2712]
MDGSSSGAWQLLARAQVHPQQAPRAIAILEAARRRRSSRIGSYRTDIFLGGWDGSLQCWRLEEEGDVVSLSPRFEIPHAHSCSIQALAAIEEDDDLLTQDSPNEARGMLVSAAGDGLIKAWATSR